MRSPSPASRASIVNSTGRLAGMPEALRPGPLALTLLASWAGSTLILKGLEEQKGWIVGRGLGESRIILGTGSSPPTGRRMTLRGRKGG